MNILFLYRNEIKPERGGVQRVTSVLSGHFELKGFNTYYLSLIKNDDELNTSPRQYFLPYSDDIEKNVSYFLDFLQSKNIHILINQSGSDTSISSLAYYAKDINVKVISVVHTSIIGGIKNFSSLYCNLAKKTKLAWLLPITEFKIVNLLLLYLYKLKHRKHYINLCQISDRIILLSESFLDEISFMIGNRSLKKILIIPNPISFKYEPLDLNSKSKILLYVGRLDTVYKRLDLLLEIWGEIFNKFPEWKLVILGGGEEYGAILNLSKKMHLERVYFEGFKNPIPYYRSASIFCMTSSSESFGMVLLEAMQFGVVPFAFSSFDTVKNIIDHEENGMLILPFSCEEYAEKLTYIMNENFIRRHMALKAYEKSIHFSIDNVGVKWLQLFEELIRKI